MIYATLFKTVPICDKSVQNVRNYLLGHSLAQFYTVKHTYARLSTKIISTRVGIVDVDITLKRNS